MKLTIGQMPLTQQLLQTGQKLCLSIILVASIPAAAVQAQTTPDGSLPTNVQKLQEIMRINGGERAGNNLFHSFDEFNLPEGMEAIFENALDIENIFTRVTGDSVSNINGILSAQGGANLFLINPNGIVFGKNAAINIGGSFIATTADSIEFADGTELVAKGESGKPILTIHFPVGLSFGSNGKNGAIEVNGEGNDIISSTALSSTQVGRNIEKLQVKLGNTLGLIGNIIDIDSGALAATNGNIELGSVGSGTVGIQQTQNTISFNYDNATQYSDINVKNEGLIYSTGSSSEAISLVGKNVNFSDGSLALIQNNGDEDASGNLNIDATDTVSLENTSTDGEPARSLRTEAIESGKGSDINVFADNVLTQKKGGFGTASYNEATAGNVNVIIEDSVNVLDGGGIGSFTYGAGKSGDINLTSQELEVTGGGQVSSTTIGTGNGGSVNVDSDFIELSGVSDTGGTPSLVGTSTFVTGVPGDVKVETSELKLIDGGFVSSNSLSDGSSGNVFVNASNSIEVSGKQGTFPSTVGSSVVVLSDEVRQRNNLPDEPIGVSGSLTINSPSITVKDRGEISVKNEGTGNAGSLTVNSKEIFLDDSGTILATSAFGQGGNIELNTETLDINDESTISAQANNEGLGGNININTTNLTAKKDSAISANADGGNGGNITIDAETILGLNNSDITANAVGGNGGNITIDSDFMVGLEERSRLTPFNDITATSEFGIDGTVTINTPDSNLDEQVYAGFKTYTVPQNRELLKQRCLNLKNPRGKIVDVGRAGVPANPNNFFDDEEVIAIEGIEDNEAKTDTEAPVWVEGDPIEEPNAVKVGADGETYLVTQTSASNASIEGVESEICTKATAPHRK